MVSAGLGWEPLGLDRALWWVAAGSVQSLPGWESPVRIVCTPARISQQSKAKETHGAAVWVGIGGVAQLIRACLGGSEVQGLSLSTY